MKLILTSILTLLFAVSTMAHEGHDKMPGTLIAPHGGQIKGTSQLYLELISEKSLVKLFAFDHDLKKINVKDLKVEARVSFPKKKTSENLILKFTDEAIESLIDAKGAHRFTLHLKIIYKGQTESLSFNVEPQNE